MATDTAQDANPQQRMDRAIPLTELALPRLSLIPTTSTIDNSELAPPPYTKNPEAAEPPSERLPEYPVRRIFGLTVKVYISIALAIVAIAALAGGVVAFNHASPSNTSNPPALNNTVAQLGFGYKGCYTDFSNNTPTLQRTLNGTEIDLQGSNSGVACASICQGWNYFGLESSFQCFCGNQILGASQRVSESSCNAACPAGSAGSSCGGTNFISLYQALNSTTT